jgi:hypothetical protein
MEEHMSQLRPSLHITVGVGLISAAALIAVATTKTAQATDTKGKGVVLQPSGSVAAVPGLTPATVVTSCIKELTVDVALTDAYLKTHVDSSASTVNINTVKLFISGSHIAGPFVDCFYRSQNGDIPNIVYHYPCKNAKQGATSYQHSYWCQK